MRKTAVALLSALVIAGCGGASEAEPEQEKPSAKKSEKVKPKFDGDAYAAAIEQTFKDGLPDPEIKSMCDDAFTHWACFYDGVTAPSKGTIRVELNTDGGWSDSDLGELADKAALHWFNFVGQAHEDLDTVIVRTNGRDSNHYRRDVPLLNR